MFEEILKQYLGSVVRVIIVTVGGFFLTKGLHIQPVIDALTSDTVIASIIGALLVVISLVWSYLKTRFNVNFVNTAHVSPASMPMGEVKALAKEQATAQVSV